MKLPHVFIDTNVFISHNYNYDSTAFKQIVSLARSEKIFIHLTTITLKEVEAHIEHDVFKAHEAFEGFREKSHVRILKNIADPPLHGIFNGFNINQAKEVLLNQFRQFLNDARVHVLEVTDVSVDEIFDKYFTRTPPFGDEKKKHEFPDAFALAALEQWCKESSGRMYVVSSDPDMSAACALNPSLRFVQSLSEFLDLLTRRGELAQFINRLFETHKNEIEERIKVAAEPLNLVYEPYGEVQYTYINSAKILKHYLIEVDGGKAVFDVIAEVNYSANVLYRNNLLGMMGGMGAREELDYGSTSIKVEVVLSFDKDNKDEFRIESTTVRNSNVYIFPDEGPDDFASKYTKAQKSLSAHAALIIDRLGGNEWVIANTPETIIKRFERTKEAIPVRVTLDLQTLSMLDTSTASLSYQGAMTIKHQAEKRSPQYRLMQRAAEAARSLDSPHVRRALEANRSLDNRLTRHAAEMAGVTDSARSRQIFEATRTFDNPRIRDVIEAAGLWRRHPLSGHSMSQDIHADISPKRLGELQSGGGSKDVKVEILLNSKLYDTTDDDEEAEDRNDFNERAETPPYEFNTSPLTITLTHNPDTPRSHETSHRLRKPTFVEWNEWSLNIERTRRYYSPDEIAEHNAQKSEEDEHATEIWSFSYSEWKANEIFYNKLIIEIAGVKLEKDEDFPADQFRKFASEIIEKLRFEIKNSVITKLYRCYCGLEKAVSSDSDGQRVYQTIPYKSSSFDVIHVLRKPTEDESYAFRTNIVRGSFSTDEEGREIIQLKLNLSTAVEFYDNLLINIENATVSGRPFSDETRSTFLEAINPVHKLRVLEPLFDVNAWYFKIDDWTLP